MSDNAVRVRFGRMNRGNLKGQRCSALVTEKVDDNTILFGISKCNLTEDRWDRERGTTQATEKLELMRSGKPKSFYQEGGVQIHHSGVFGSCKVENIMDLIHYFERITEYLPKPSTGSITEVSL